MSPRLAAIITAAGASSRMGRHKALLAWRDTTLVAHQVGCLHAAGFEPVVVVVGSEADKVRAAVPEGAQAVYNAEWARGRSGSIEAGASALPDELDAILVVGVDQPLTSAVLDRLVPHAGAPLVEPVDPSGNPGHPVLLGAEHLPALQSLHEQPEGLRSLVHTLRPRGVQVRVPELRHWDLNSPEDYRRAIDEDAHLRSPT